MRSNNNIIDYPVTKLKGKHTKNENKRFDPMQQVFNMNFNPLDQYQDIDMLELAGGSHVVQDLIISLL